MSKSIRISPKHGVNPCISVCFFCGKDKNEIAMLGKLKGDKQAPMRAVLDYTPCDTCKAAMALGITLVECVDHPIEGTAPIQGGLYPTGRWAVVTEDAAGRFLTSDVLPVVLKHRRTFIDPVAADKIGLFEKEVG